jgi:YrbI family 3-deoxy-D-manno-octulosonate 8-phosphate phosphatase
MVAGRRPDVLAIVPASRDPRTIACRDLRLLAGHPLIAYSIASATLAGSITRVIILTDDPRLAEASRDFGAETPFAGQRAYALDEPRGMNPAREALSWLKRQEGYEPEVAVVLRTECPLRPPDLVDNAVAMLRANPNADCVRSVVAPGWDSAEAWIIPPDGWLRPLQPVAGHDGASPARPGEISPKVCWQTGHVEVVRPAASDPGKTRLGCRTLGVVVEEQYCVDVDTGSGWLSAERALSTGSVTTIDPGRVLTRLPGARRPLPARVSLLALDFDGVLTDNRVWVAEDGTESVVCSREDSLGLQMLRERGITAMVISRETSPIVAARCRKLGIPCWQGVEDKSTLLRRLVVERGLTMDEVVYLGNDVNDLTSMQAVGCGVAVSDAHPHVVEAADLVVSKPGGRGAIRELCDRILAQARESDGWIAPGGRP